MDKRSGVLLLCVAVFSSRGVTDRSMPHTACMRHHQLILLIIEMKVRYPIRNCSALKSIMEPAKATLCQYCSEIVPINHKGHTTRPFYATVSSFRRHSKLCSLCTYIREHLDVEELETGFLDAAALCVRLKEPNESKGKVKWALLELSIRHVVATEEVTSTHTFSVTQCASTCELSMSILGSQH
jgi:hypothetical protein